MSTKEWVMVVPFSILILLITLMLFVGYPLWAWNNWSIKRELSHEQIIEGPLLTPYADYDLIGCQVDRGLNRRK